MTTPSPKLQLAVPSQVDPFSTDDLAANWGKIDAAPGSFICTSTTRPVWTSAQAGRKILETNTGLEWWWDGDEWKRLAAIGLLKKVDGTFAIGERTTDFSTGSATYVKVTSVTSVVVPDGHRPIRVEVSWLNAGNASGGFNGAIFRSNTNNSGPNMGIKPFGVPAGGDAKIGGDDMWAIERNGLNPGNYDFSFQINAPAGNSTIYASATTPCSITVIEL